MARPTGDMERADIVIVGGGFAGATAAAALADGRRKIVVLEARTGIDPRFRGELIHAHGAAMLGELGLLQALYEGGGSPVKGFAVMQIDGPSALLPYADIRPDVPNGIAMDHREMLQCLRRQAVARPGVDLRLGWRVAEVVREQGRVVGARTSEGREVRAELTLVADGRHSKMRTMLGFAEETRLVSFTVALDLEAVSLPYVGYGHVFLGGWGPVLAYPIGHERVRMCVDLPAGAEKGREAVIQQLRDEYARLLPQGVRAAMLRALDRGDIEICANHAVSARRCVAPGVALLGDSGGCSHPLTAAGMTTALNDVRLLQAELASGRPLDEALAIYEKKRFRFVVAREVLADSLYEVFRGAEEGSRAIRTGIFRYWTKGPRGRAASMALLSGHESGVGAFVMEYLKVLRETTRCVIRRETMDRDKSRSALMRSTLRVSFDLMGRTFNAVRHHALG